MLLRTFIWISATVGAALLPGAGLAQTETTSASRHGATLGEKVDAGIEATMDGANKAADWTRDGAAKGWDATSQGASDATEWSKEKSSEAWDATRSGTGKAVEWTKEKSGEAWEATKSGAADVGEKTREGYETAKEKVTGNP